MLGFGTRRQSAGPAPLDGVSLVLADLDGVIYRGANAVPGAVEAMSAAARGGAKLAYLTNNASRPARRVAEHLSGFGLEVTPGDVVTSPEAAVRVLAEHVAPGALILVVGGEGITDVLEAEGYRVTRSADDVPDAVMQGFAHHVGWEHLAEASFALARGIPWIATNQDWTIPVARGVAPGNGTLVSAVHTVVGRLPAFAGKPERHMYDLALDRFAGAPASTLMIGDRLDTDIAGANRAGIRGVLVLTGIDRPKQALAAKPHERPAFILEHLGQLHEPYSVLHERRDGNRMTVSSAGESVSVAGVQVRVESSGSDRLNLLRAACGAIAASGKTIYELDVPLELADDWLA